MQVKTIIVDDEPPICDEIEYLLKREADIEIAAKFTNALDALSYLANTACDLVFLDIKMPGMSGLDIARKLGALQRPPLVVFSTAFPEHALDAFDTLAVGYITKPITQTNISKVVAKVRTILERGPRTEKPSINRVCVMKNGSYIPIDKYDIVFVYVRNKEVYIRTREGEYATSLTIHEVEKILPEPHFLRVHRQYLVNLDKVAEIIPWFRGSYMLRMEAVNSDAIPVSRNKTKELKTLMGMH